MGESPAWRPPLREHALALYARDEVATACLALQDRGGVDVCELLWGCWLHHHGLTFDADLGVTLAPVRAWQAEVTQPLRRLRRALKARALADPGIGEVREAIKRAELEAERETLSRLQALADAGRGIRPLSPRDPRLARRLAQGLSIPQESPLSALDTLESRLDPPRLPR